MNENQFCPQCGTKLEPDAKFCPKCGGRVLDAAERMAPVNEQAGGNGTKNGKKKDIWVNIIAAVLTVFGVLCLLCGYIRTAIIFLIAGAALWSKVYRKFPGNAKKVCVAVVVVCVVAGCISFMLQSVDDSYISIVKEGTLPGYQEQTIGEAFDGFFKDASWKYFISDNSTDIVEFTGKCTYGGKEVTAKIQFKVYADDTFEISYVSYNDVAQDLLDVWLLMNDVYE